MAKKEAEAKEAEMSLAAALTALENSAATVKEQRRAVPLHCLTMHYEVCSAACRARMTRRQPSRLNRPAISNPTPHLSLGAG